GPVPGELLRPACHLSVRWAGRAGAHVDGGAARPAVTGALALLRPGPGDGATAGGEPLARGADRVVELVPRVPDAEAPSALPGHRVGSRDVRDAARGRLPGVAADAARADGGLRPAGDAELDVSGRRHGRAGPPARRDGVHPELHLQLEQGLRDLQTLRGLAARDQRPARPNAAHAYGWGNSRSVARWAARSAAGGSCVAISL